MQINKTLQGPGVFITELASERKVHLNTIRNAIKRYKINLCLMPGTHFPYRKRQAITKRAAVMFRIEWCKEHPIERLIQP